MTKTKKRQKEQSATRTTNRVLFRRAVRDHLLYKLALLAFVIGLPMALGVELEQLGLMLVNLSLTVLVVDFLSEQRNQYSRRQEYIANMGSNNNDFAVQGIENLRAGGWLAQGAVRGAKYLGANWAGADLSGADLKNAELLDVDLTGASIDDVDLEGATLTNDQYRNVVLPRIIPNTTKLQNVQAPWIDLTDRDLRAAQLTGAKLHGAKFDRSNLAGASLKDTDLTDANLQHATSVEDADFSGAILDRTLLPNNLLGANFVESKIQGCRSL